MQVFALGVQDRYAAVIGLEKFERAVDHEIGDLVEIGPGVDVVRNFEHQLDDLHLFLFFVIEPRVLQADGDLAGQPLDQLHLGLRPMVRLVAVVQPHYAQQFIAKDERGDQHRTRANKLQRSTHPQWNVRRMNVVYREVARVRQVPFDRIYRDQSRRDVEAESRLEPVVAQVFVADAKAAVRRRRDHIATVYSQPLADLGHGGLQKFIDIDDDGYADGVL